MNIINNHSIIPFKGKTKIVHAKKEDLRQVANLQKEIYNERLDEGWTEESALNFINYSYNKQPDLFFVAKKDNKVAGYTFGFIKPWADGNHLMCEEIVVSPSSQKEGIARNLQKLLVDTAIKKYNVTQAEATTYYGENQMPMKWYEKLGWKKEQDLFLINAFPNELLTNLKK